MCTPSDTTIQYFIVILLLAASFSLRGHHQANIYQKLKNGGAFSTNVNFYGIVNSLHNYYQLLNVLSVVSCAEIL